MKDSTAIRLVEHVGRRKLTTFVLVLCPLDEGDAQRYPHVKDIPSNRQCSCGCTHSYRSDDVEVMFDVPEPK